MLLKKNFSYLHSPRGGDYITPWGPHGETPVFIRRQKEMRGEVWPSAFTVFHGKGKAGQEKLFRTG